VDLWALGALIYEFLAGCALICPLPLGVFGSAGCA
jgi:hypothetical protein